MLVWVVCGNALAGLFLSAGPAFYGAVTGDEGRFAAQLAFLAHGAQSTNSAVTYQTYLWSLHQYGTAGFGSGISAFPSVHVAVAALNALFLWSHSSRLGLIAFAYIAVIVASSVYLAWHYAIDGYASIAIIAVIYFGAKYAEAWVTGDVGGRQAHSFLSATSSTR
jgi:membrane-associated phospholipid phosphatase